MLQSPVPIVIVIRAKRMFTFDNLTPSATIESKSHIVLITEPCHCFDLVIGMMLVTEKNLGNSSTSVGLWMEYCRPLLRKLTYVPNDKMLHSSQVFIPFRIKVKTCKKSSAT